MKIDIEDLWLSALIASKLIEHQNPGGTTQEINIPTLNWEVINMIHVYLVLVDKWHHLGYS